MRVYTLVFSIVVHAAALIALVIVPVVANGELPDLRRPIEWIAADPVTLPEPPAAPRRGHASSGEFSAGAAPIVAPERVTPDTSIDFAEPGGSPEGASAVPGGMDVGALMPAEPAPPPAPPAAKPAPVRVGGAISQPRKIKDVAPVYPAIAQSARVQGVVILEAVIGEDGEVRDVRLLRSIPLLDQAAIDAVRRWEFTPTLLNGERVPIVMTVTVRFTLSH